MLPVPKNPLERAGLSARPAARESGRHGLESAGGHQRRLRAGLPDRALGGALRQRAVPQLRGVLRRLQHQRPGAALHDGRAGRRPHAGRSHAAGVGAGRREPGQEARAAIEWEAKGVTPILYPGHQHARPFGAAPDLAGLGRDLPRRCAGKERIVVAHAMARPSASTRQDDFVGRMLWALSDPAGLPARRFAEFNPVPSLDWLEPLREDRYGHTDLGRFGVPPRTTPTTKLRFSLIRRPAPYPLAPSMRMVDAGGIAATPVGRCDAPAGALADAASE